MKPSDIKYIVVHAADTKPNMDIGAKEIRKWHIYPKFYPNTGEYRYQGKMYRFVDDLPFNVRKKKGRGWSDIGYHFVIRRNGELETGRPLDVSGAHVRGYNSMSWGVCLIGGMSEKGNTDCNFTNKQYITLKLILGELEDKAPKAKVIGHRDFKGVDKACPTFNAKDFYYE